jgi:glycosyltransferase involved in cell wall biosynthesis
VTPERPLRVLMVTGAYHPEISSGGLQAQMVARAAGDSVAFHVLTTATDPALPRESRVDNVDVSRIVVDVNSTRSKLQATDEMIRELVALLRSSDVVHVHGYSTKNLLVTPLSAILRVPVVLSLHTAGFDEPASIAARGRLARWSFDMCRLYLCVSPLLTDACRAAGVPDAKVRYAPNGVDLERFRPVDPAERPAVRRSLGLDPAHPMILFVGFFSRDKQPHVLFDAWLRLQREPATESALVFVGATHSPYFEVDARLAGDMRDRARHEGIADRLIFVDPTPHIDEYYRAADVFALPSLREGMPVALLEAMASGVPAVASRLPGSTDVLIDDGKSGALVPPGDVDAFAHALGRVLTDPTHAASLGSAARDRVAAEFTADRVAAKWIAAYRDVTTRAA